MRRERVARRGPAARGRGPAPASPRKTTEFPAANRGASRAAWLAIATLAIALLVIVLGPHRIGAFDVESDFYGGYAPAAISIQHGRIVPAGEKLPSVFGFVGPLYPTLLALGGFALADLFFAAELLSLIACVGVVVLWFLLLRRRAGAELALVVVLLLVTNPLLVRYGYSATTDTTALALQSAALWILFTRGGNAAAAGAGLLAGLATLTRYTSVYLIPAGLVAIAMGATLHPRRGRATALLVLGFLALTLPWQIYAGLHGAQVQFHQLLAFDVYGNARGMSWDDFLAQIWPRFEHSPLAVFTTDPGAVARRLFFNLGDHLRRDAMHLLGWPVAVPGVLAPLLAYRDRGLLRLAPLALPGVWAFLALVPAAHNERYSLAVLPFYVLLAGATLTSSVWHAAQGSRPRAAWAKRALVGAVVGTSLLATIREQIQVIEQQPLETLVCAKELRRLARPGDRVIARKPNLAFHAGIGSVYFPAVDSLGALARYAVANRARWLFVSPPEALLRPRTAFLLDTSATVPGLTLRAYSSVPTLVDHTLRWQRVAVLYEIGPAFGESPAWFTNDTLFALHTLRGMAATNPNAQVLLKLAMMELLRRNLAGAQAAWRDAARIDPRGMANLLGRFGGDTLQSVVRGQSLLR